MWLIDIPVVYGNSRKTKEFEEAICEILVSGSKSFCRDERLGWWIRIPNPPECLAEGVHTDPAHEPL